MKPNKPLLILDLDETLIHATLQPLEYASDFVVFKYHIYKRPHLHYFLTRVNEYFTLAIWSSASDDYVQEVVSRILPKDIQLAFIWGRSRCTPKIDPKVNELGYYSDHYWSHHHYIKPLKKVKRIGFDLKQVLIVDDTPRKVANSYGNAIYPKAFMGSASDDHLPKLLQYLKKIQPEKNYRTLEKRFWFNEVN